MSECNRCYQCGQHESEQQIRVVQNCDEHAGQLVKPDLIHILYTVTLAKPKYNPAH